jgi:hypothetical protein
MKQLRREHNLLFRILRDHCLFLNRKQIEGVLTQPTSTAKRELTWLVSGKFLARRYRADSFIHFQTPLYYLGEVGWRLVGKATAEYKSYQRNVEERSGPQIAHLLAINDVLLKFMLEADVKRIIGGEDGVWHESFGFGNIPDAWIQFAGGEAFIEVDRGSEHLGVVANKLSNYRSFKDSGGYGLMFPGCRFRVLFITTTVERIESLQRVTRSDDIWFATMDEFLCEKLHHQHWFAVNGHYALPLAPKEEVQKLWQAQP